MSGRCGEMLSIYALNSSYELAYQTVMAFGFSGPTKSRAGRLIPTLCLSNGLKYVPAAFGASLEYKRPSAKH